MKKSVSKNKKLSYSLLYNNKSNFIMWLSRTISRLCCTFFVCWASEFYEMLAIFALYAAVE